MAAPKDLRKLIETAEKQGWRVEPNKKGHYAFYSPNGRDIVIFAGTPSDHRSWKNSIAHLRRAGLDLPH